MNIFPKKKYIMWGIRSPHSTPQTILWPLSVQPSIFKRQEIVKIFAWVKEGKNLHLSLDSAWISSLLTGKIFDWWCFQASKSPWSQMCKYGFIQKGETSILMNENEETYNLSSKGRQEWPSLMEKIKRKHTLPEHEETKGGVFVSTMNKDGGG